MFLDSLEDAKYNPKNDFGITDCVVCLEKFVKDEDIKRIPTCKHFFHPKCCDNWFLLKEDETEQKCPQCNLVLKTKEMQALKPLD